MIEELKLSHFITIEPNVILNIYLKYLWNFKYKFIYIYNKNYIEEHNLEYRVVEGTQIKYESLFNWR